MRALAAAVVICVLAIAGAVLYVSESERSTAETNFQEARTADQLRVLILDEVRGVDGYLESGEQFFLAAYTKDRAELRRRLADARELCSDDAMELRLIARMTAAHRDLNRLADKAVAEKRGGTLRTDHFLTQGQGNLDLQVFLDANSGFGARLAENRKKELRAAALVPVKVMLGMGALFMLLGGIAMRRALRSQRARRDAETAERTAADRYRQEQARFAEALQLSEDETEASVLLARHLDRTVARSTTVVLKLDDDGERLRPMTAVNDTSLAEKLPLAEPGECMAIRLSRRHAGGGRNPDLFECDLCGRPDGCQTCNPLVVGGKVLGSVLTLHECDPDDEDDRRLSDTAAQAAPVLANLRNLAIAEERAATDALTGLPNKRAFDEMLERMVAQASRSHSPLSAVIMDLDHFKRVNDTYGHEMGDKVLASFGAMLQAEQRASDFTSRTGGEEFVVLLPDTDAEGAANVAEKLRLALHGLGDGPVSLTGSFGVATFPEHGPDAKRLLRLADRALYAAKRNGRDRVELAGDVSGSETGAGVTAGA